MVNPGHRSRACDYCRSVKVKCDEGRPTCTRCLKRGQACMYSTNEVFRSMNSWSEASVQQRVAVERLRRLQEPEPARAIPLDWVDASIGPFFDQFVIYPDALLTTWGSFTGLPRVYGTPDSPECLDQAIRACALIHMANTSKIVRLELAAGEAYRDALIALRETLSSPNFSKDDALVTIKLLITYEAISGIQPPKELFHAHFQGQAALLRAKLSSSAPFPSSSPPFPSFPHSSSPMFPHPQSAPSIFPGITAHTNRLLLWRDLGERQRPTLGLASWPPDTHRSWLDEATTRITALVAALCGQIRELQESLDTLDNWHAALAECVDQVAKVDLVLRECVEGAPEEYRGIRGGEGRGERGLAIPESVPVRALSNLQCPILEFRKGKEVRVDLEGGWGEEGEEGGDGGKERGGMGIATEAEGEGREEGSYVPRRDTFPSPAIAQLWNYIRCAELHLCRAMIDLHLLVPPQEVPHQPLSPPLTPFFSTSLLPPGFPSISELRTRLSDAIHELLASVHYLMGDVLAADGTRVPVVTGNRASLLFTLHKVCAVPGLSWRVKSWVLAVFERIGTEGHLRAGLNMKRLYSQRVPRLPE